MRRPSVLTLVDLIYGAACDPTQWTRVLESLSQAMGGSGADLAVFDVEKSATSFNAAVGILGPEFQRDYLHGFAASDPWFLVAQTRGLFRTGTMAIGEDLISMRELARTDFHNDFGKKHEYFGGLTVVLSANGHSAATLSVCRRERHVFGETQMSLMRHLMPHLQRAVQVHERLAESSKRVTDLAAALNGLSTGAILVSADGTVLIVNDSAAETLAQRDGLTMDRGELRAERPRDTADLRCLIRGSANNGSDLLSGGVLVIERPSSGRRPLQLVVSPLPSHNRFAQGDARAIIFVTDPDRVQEPDLVRLRRVYKLSRAEADVAGYLLQEKSVRETGDILGISMNTVRFHLKQLFSKTQTRRQSELVRLLSSTMQVRRR